MTLRDQIREWLGIEALSAEVLGLRMRLDDAEASITRMLKVTQDIEREQARARKIQEIPPTRRVPRYADYETAQVEALNEFQEKK